MYGEIDPNTDSGQYRFWCFPKMKWNLGVNDITHSSLRIASTPLGRTKLFRYYCSV